MDRVLNISTSLSRRIHCSEVLPYDERRQHEVTEPRPHKTKITPTKPTAAVRPAKKQDRQDTRYERADEPKGGHPYIQQYRPLGQRIAPYEQAGHDRYYT